VGRSVLLRVEKGPPNPGPPVLEIAGLRVRDDRHAVAVDDLDLVVHSGEIVGLAGVEGNGQTELVEALTGLRHAEAGRVTLLGRDVTNARPRQLSQAGLSHVPEDRHKHGLVLAHPLAENLVLSSYSESPFARGLRIVFDAIRRYAARLIGDYDIRTPSTTALAGTLSGGNQQKAVVAREFSRPLKLLIAAQPTRGVDVGATEFIHRKIVEARDAGAGVLLVSAELDEVLGLADRVGVLYRGRLLHLTDAAHADRAHLGLLLGGASG
jgi:general nucleoside transport system ATP-binding protein